MTGADALGPGPVDQVTVTGIAGHGHHGVLAAERRDGQLFRADVVLHVPTHRAAARDDLAAAVDYAVVAARVREVLTGPAFDLVETVADRIAAAVLAEERVLAVEVTVHKPQAPVGVPFDDVTVRIMRTRADVEVARAPEESVPVVLALGSNLGDREATLRSAVSALGAVPGLEVVSLSPVAETAPVGGPEQPRFLNAVLLTRTTLSARAVLHACQDVEDRHDRVRRERWGPRTLDIDLVSYGQLVTRTLDLELPHPRAAERAFVLLPWLLIDPDATLPGRLGPTRVADELARLAVPEDSVVLRADVSLRSGGD